MRRFLIGLGILGLLAFDAALVLYVATATRPCPVLSDATMKEIDDAWAAGYVWGKAGCK